MFIIEIVLTIFAWRKGWKWYSLLPLGFVILIGLLIGFSVRISGGNSSYIKIFGPILDIIAIIILIILNIKDHKINNEINII
jgi:uncharacterized membrane protein YfcA